MTCSGIDASPSFPGASTVSSSSRFVVEGVFWESGGVHSFEVVDPVLFVFESHVLYSRDLQFFPYDFSSYFIQSCIYVTENKDLLMVCDFPMKGFYSGVVKYGEK